MKTPNAIASVLWTLGLLVASGAPLLAADSIKLKDGSRLEGQAVDYDAEARVLSFQTVDGQVRKLPLDELDGRSVYHVTRSKVEQTNGKGQLKLANYARDIELFAHAARHYRYAAEADPSLAGEIATQTEVLKKEAAGWGMGRAQQAIAAGDSREAEKWLKLLIEKLPDQPEAEQARQILDSHYDKVRQEKDDAVEAAKPDLLTGELKTAKTYYDRMVEENKQGLTQKRPGSTSERLWNNAIKHGERSLKELDKQAKTFTDPETVATVGKYREILVEQIIEIRMTIASYYMTRSSYNQAASEVNKALALDPNNKSAAAMRVRIEQASSEGIRWW